MNWGTKEIAVASVIGIIVVFAIYKIFIDKKEEVKEKPCPTVTPPIPYTNKTVRQKLEELCPTSVSETRNGKVYIVKGNDALRDEYLYGPCTTAGTCNSTNADPVSQTLINKLTKPLHHCGAWDMKDYVYDGYNTRKWVANATSPVYTLPGPVPYTETFLTRMCDDTRKIILQGAYPLNSTFTSIINPQIIRPICANMKSSGNLLEYKKEKTDWIFPLYDDGKVKMVLVTLVLKSEQGTPSIYIYVRKSRTFETTPPDMTFGYNIVNFFLNTNVVENTPLTYGLQNLTYSIYNKIRPVIDDHGYGATPRGWFDVEGTGEATYYCRDTADNPRIFNCVKQDGSVTGVGDVVISGLPDYPVPRAPQYANKTPINLDTKYKASIY